MSKSYDRSVVSMARGEYGYKSTSQYIARTCPQCNKQYKRFPGETEYVYGGKKFCDWNCKCTYRREHPSDKEELSFAEQCKIRLRKDKGKDNNV